jgi:hypothetical protein
VFGLWSRTPRSSKAAPGGPSGRRTRRRPQLEPLEDRCVLSTSNGVAIYSFSNVASVSLAYGSPFTSAAAEVRGRQVTVIANVAFSSADAGRYDVLTNWGDVTAGKGPDVSLSPLFSSPANANTTLATPGSATRTASISTGAATATYTSVASHTYSTGGVYTITLDLAQTVTNLPVNGPAQAGLPGLQISPPQVPPGDVGSERFGGDQSGEEPSPRDLGPAAMALSLELQRSASRSYDVMAWVRMADPRPLQTQVEGTENSSSTAVVSGTSAEAKPALETAVFQPGERVFSSFKESGTNPDGAAGDNNRTVAATPARQRKQTVLARLISSALPIPDDDSSSPLVIVDQQEQLAVFVRLLQNGIEDDDTDSGLAAADSYFVQLQSKQADQKKDRGHGGDIVLLLFALAAVAPTTTDKLWRRL